MRVNEAHSDKHFWKIPKSPDIVINNPCAPLTILARSERSQNSRFGSIGYSEIFRMFEELVAYRCGKITSWSATSAPSLHAFGHLLMHVLSFLLFSSRYYRYWRMHCQTASQRSNVPTLIYLLSIQHRARFHFAHYTSWESIYHRGRGNTHDDDHNDLIWQEGLLLKSQCLLGYTPTTQIFWPDTEDLRARSAKMGVVTWVNEIRTKPCYRISYDTFQNKRNDLIVWPEIGVKLSPRWKEKSVRRPKPCRDPDASTSWTFYSWLICCSLLLK